MLMNLRQAVHRPAFKYFLFGLLILSFGLWGIADLFIPSGGVNQTVMTAGERDFSYGEVEQSYRRELRLLGIDRGGADERVLRAVLSYSLDKLAVGVLSAQEVDRHSVGAGRGRILDEIRGNSNFRDGFGNFDSLLFSRFLSLNGLSESDYIELLSQDIGARYWVESLQSILVLPPRLSSIYVDYLRQERDISYIAIPYGGVGVADLSESEIELYFSSNDESYRVPEMRNFSLVEISSKTLDSASSPSESDVRSAYDSGFYAGSGEERRDFRFVVLGDESLARDIYDVLVLGKDFSSVVSGYDVEVQEFVGQAFGEIGEGRLAESVFGIDRVGGVDIYEGDFGWVIATVDSIDISDVLDYAAVRSDIVSALKAERLEDLIYESAQMLETRIGEGSSLAEAAFLLGLRVEDMTVSEDSADIGADILGEVFSLPVSEESSLIERRVGAYGSDSGSATFFMVRVNSIAESYIPEFSQVRDIVKRDIERINRLELLRGDVADLRAGKMSLSSYAKRRGVSVKRAVVVINGDDDDYPEFLNSQSFKENSLGYVGANEEDSRMVIGVLGSIRLRDSDEGDDIGEQLLLRLEGNVLNAAYESLLRDKYKVTYNEDALNLLISGGLGVGLGG